MSGADRPVRARAGGTSGDPFAVLGLTPRADLTDDDVRAAWRRVAAVTHPDLADGGDPARFADAAAAYTELRSQFGRGEARAALAEETGATQGRWRPAVAAHGRRGAIRDAWISAIRRPTSALTVRLAVRVVIAATGAAVGWLAAGGGPAGPALATGAGTWLILTARRDLPAGTRRHASGRS